MRSVEGWDPPTSTLVRDTLLSLWEAAVSSGSNVMKLHAALVSVVLPKLNVLPPPPSTARGKALVSLLEVVLLQCYLEVGVHSKWKVASGE